MKKKKKYAKFAMTIVAAFVVFTVLCVATRKNVRSEVTIEQIGE